MMSFIIPMLRARGNLPRIYPILDTETLSRRGCSAEMAAAALLEAGAGILQFRHKGQFGRAVFELVERVAELCRRAGALFLVNNRADIALLVDAGLHLGQDDLPPSDARRLIGPGHILGFSTHNAAQLAAAAAGPADYLAIGPVFETHSKQNPDPAVGLEALRKLRRSVQLPLIAIGGITLANARQVLEAGADSVAVIHGMLPEICTFESVRARMREWQRVVNS